MKITKSIEKKFVFVFMLFGLLLFLNASFAYILPDNIEKMKIDNNEYALDFLGKISFIMAFFAGILSFLSPCILPFLPAFFSYTFKEKTNITKMTFVFFLGFASAFTLIGLIASYLGQGLSVFQGNFEYIVVISGVFLVLFGLMSFFGKGFSSIIKQKSVKRDDEIGIFIFGVLFALGWTACLGPVLAGILVISINLNNYFYTAGLMVAYSLGIFLPLLLASVIFDKYNISKMPLFAGKGIEFKIAGKKIVTHSTNMISGIIFIAIGIAFMVFKGTGFVNSMDFFGTKILFYEFQRVLLSINIPNFDLYITVFTLAVVLYFLFGKKFFQAKNN